MIDFMIAEDSIFISEGKAILVEEFGKDYGTYFSILTLIARGKTTRNEIESSLGKEIGGYLTKLEDEFGLIAKHQPLFEKSSQKCVRYQLHDNFLAFWFRFIHRFSYMVEINAFGPLKDIIRRDYNVFSGKALEGYFREVLIEQGKYTRISSWWDRKGENEIDLIAENELEKRADFFEVKRQASKFDPKLLDGKIKAFLLATGRFKDHKISGSGLSMSDML